MLLWHPPEMGQKGTIIWLFCTAVLARTLVSMCEVPSIALVPELTADYDERTRLLTVRSLFEALGGIGISALAYNVFPRERADGSGGLLSGEGYPTFALFTGAVMHARLKQIGRAHV